MGKIVAARAHVPGSFFSKTEIRFLDGSTQILVYCRASMIRFALLLPILLPISVSSQQADPKIAAAARELASRMGEVTMAQSISSHISMYKKAETGNYYELVSTEREGTHSMGSRGKEMKRELEDQPHVPAANEYNRISIFNHEGTIYLKSESRSTMQGLSEQPLKFEGVYEAIVLEGTWDGFQKGETFVIRLCEDCTKRFSGDIHEYLENPQRLSAIEQEFRKKYLQMHQKIYEERGAGDSKEARAVQRQFPIVKHLIENATIGVAVSQSGMESVTYSFEGEDLTTKTGEYTSETHFRLSLP